MIWMRLVALSCALLVSACAIPEQNWEKEPCIPIRQSSSSSIKKLAIEVKGKGNFPSAMIEGIVMEILSAKGYEIVGRSEVQRKVEREQRILSDQNRSNEPEYSPNMPGADAIFILEVTDWKATHKQGVTYIERLVMVGKLVNTESKFIWIKNAGLGQRNIVIIGRRTSPVVDTTLRILDSFPPCH